MYNRTGEKASTLASCCSLESEGKRRGAARLDVIFCRHVAGSAITGSMGGKIGVEIHPFSAPLLAEDILDFNIYFLFLSASA